MIEVEKILEETEEKPKKKNPFKNISKMCKRIVNNKKALMRIQSLNEPSINKRHSEKANAVSDSLNQI